MTSKLQFSFLFSIIIFALSACYNGEEQAFLDAVDVNRLGIVGLNIEQTPSKSIIEVNETLALSVAADLDDGGTLPVSDLVTWSVSDSSIASVANDGTLTGLADGMVEVTASLADIESTASIQVSSSPLTILTISSSPASARECTHGHEIEVQGTYGDGRTDSNIPFLSWSTDDTAVATVDDEGSLSILSVGSGSFDVTVSRDDVSLDDTATITVDDNLLSITLLPTTATITEGDTLQFTATGSFAAGADADVTPTSAWVVANSDGEDDAHLSVSGEGLVTALTDGEATVVASCGGEDSPAVTVTVEDPVVVDRIVITAETEGPYNVSDDEVQLTATIQYSDGSTYLVVPDDSEFVEWTATRETGTAAEVDSTSGLVTFSEEGVTEIEVTYYDSDEDFGLLEATFRITVED